MWKEDPTPAYLPVRVRAALPSLTQFAPVFHLPASLSALPLSPSTTITIVDFFDEDRSCRPDPIYKSPKKNLDLLGRQFRPLECCPQMNWGRTQKKQFRVMTFHLSLPNGARLRLIAITDLLPTRHGWAQIRHCTLISTKLNRKLQMSKWDEERENK
jgi:hypothetical protein